MLTYTPTCGESIDSAIQNALDLSQKTYKSVSMTFNGLTGGRIIPL